MSGLRLGVTLKSITPVSWGGYDGTTDPIVVRVPSIRGSMRKWYRWYISGQISRNCSEPEHEEIRDKDFGVFGGVHGGARKSKVRIWFDFYEKTRELKLNDRYPFLWPLRRRYRTFYMINTKLVLEGGCKYLVEAAKALALNISFGGFGFRASRGYGNFVIESVEGGCGEALKYMSMAKEVTLASSPSLWIDKALKFMKELGVRRCNGLWNIQTISNSYLLSTAGSFPWDKALRDIEFRMKRIERSLRARNKRERDIRVLLGSPIIDPFKKRPYWWPERRSSPLIVGLGGTRGNYIRGILLPSKDYPEKVLKEHFHGAEQLAQHFKETISKKLREEGFLVKEVGE